MVVDSPVDVAVSASDNYEKKPPNSEVVAVEITQFGGWACTVSHSGCDRDIVYIDEYSLPDWLMTT